MHSMVRLFKAGLVAAALQLVTVVAVTAGAVLLGTNDIIRNGTGAAYLEEMLLSLAPILTWAYLVTAAGWSFTETPLIQSAAARFKSAANFLPEFGPTDALRTLLVGCCITAVGLFVLGLRGSPARWSNSFDLTRGVRWSPRCLGLRWQASVLRLLVRTHTRRGVLS